MDLLIGCDSKEMEKKNPKLNPEFRLTHHPCTIVRWGYVGECEFSLDLPLGYQLDVDGIRQAFTNMLEHLDVWQERFVTCTNSFCPSHDEHFKQILKLYQPSKPDKIHYLQTGPPNPPNLLRLPHRRECST